MFAKLQNYINGSYQSPLKENYMDNSNPATGEIISLIPISDALDVDMAVRSARQAAPSWKSSSGELRFRILSRIADLIDRDIEALALAETNDTGKPLHVSRSVDIPRASSNFRFFATASMQFSSESHWMPGKAINYTLRQPIGIVACISPWNLPLYLFSWKIAPALAAGNCVISKPSELSPTTAMMLGKICTEAGLPSGVLNIILGDGPTTGQAIIDHEDISAISFTGGTKTGAHIATQAAPKFKKLSLELGGKNPCIIFEDCDYELTLREVQRLSFSNQGQICLCGSRILIQESIYNKFRDDLVSRIQALRIGDPLIAETQIGSVISSAHAEKVMSYISLAQQEGGKILCGGSRYQVEGRCSNGNFIRPTILENLGPNCRTNMEEIFGPVISLQVFKDEEEALQLANASRYGLASTVWTSDLQKAHRMAEKLNTGIVWINCWLLRDLRTPFGGMNDSGVGREGGWEAMKFFTEAKNVCIKTERNS